MVSVKEFRQKYFVLNFIIVGQQNIILLGTYIYSLFYQSNLFLYFAEINIYKYKVLYSIIYLKSFNCHEPSNSWEQFLLHIGFG